MAVFASALLLALVVLVETRQAVLTYDVLEVWRRWRVIFHLDDKLLRLVALLVQRNDLFHSVNG